LGYNKYNGFMAGAVFYNEQFPKRPLSFNLAPMFAFGSKSLVGMGEVRYNLYPNNGPFKNIELGVGGRSFTFDSARDTSVEIDTSMGVFELSWKDVRYYRVVPELTFELKEKSKRSAIQKFIKLRHISLFTDDLEDKYEKPNNYFDKWRYVNEISFVIKDKNILRPKSMKLAFQQASEYMLGTVDLSYAFKYVNNEKLKFRVFGGYFFENETADVTKDLSTRAYLNLAGTGNYDLNFDNLYFGRSEIDGIFVRQVYSNMGGGFKIASSAGVNFEWLASMNIESGIPLIEKNLPIRMFLDIGVSPEVYDGFDTVELRSIFSTKALFAAGVAVSLLNDNVRINIPFFNSSELSSQKPGNDFEKFARKITYEINLNEMNPFKFTRKLKI